ncbi:MAG TPA: tyrosine--tRNA ligase [Candidatus Methylomirabilis sp.]|nr:tyrosine--tRNA ligase [Candidatus Methylomirabilis sp.]
MSATKFKPVEEQLVYLKKGAAEIIPEPELKAKLEKSFRTGKPMRVYLGVDPTAPDIHLGHTVVLRKLKHFQDLGHTAIFLIGDFSAAIGDPTGRSETRPPLSREEVDANAKTYLDQVFKLLDREKTEVRRNSEWLDKLSSQEIVRLCGRYSLARMLEREDFRSRLDNQQPISVHELLYPLLTAVDAVQLKSDVELGATEQKFNLLIHRHIQREYGLEGEVAFTMPILAGLDGQRKMSKSFGNYVGITEPPDEMFGKLMSVPDELMWSYFELLTDRPSDEIERLKRETNAPAPVALSRSTLRPRRNPMEVKMELAAEVVTTFHGPKAADEAKANFTSRFRERLTPRDMEEIRLVHATATTFFVFVKRGNIEESRPPITLTGGTGEKWSRLLSALHCVESVSKAEQLIKGDGLDIDEVTVKDPSTRVDLAQPATYVLKIGKRKFVRIVVE